MSRCSLAVLATLWSAPAWAECSVADYQELVEQSVDIEVIARLCGPESFALSRFVDWAQVLDAGADTTAWAIQITGDGSIALTGTSQRDSGETDAFAAMLTQQGVIERFISLTLPGDQHPQDIAVHPSGDIYLSGIQVTQADGQTGWLLQLTAEDTVDFETFEWFLGGIRHIIGFESDDILITSGDMIADFPRSKVVRGNFADGFEHVLGFLHVETIERQVPLNGALALLTRLDGVEGSASFGLELFDVQNAETLWSRHLPQSGPSIDAPFGPFPDPSGGFALVTNARPQGSASGAQNWDREVNIHRFQANGTFVSTTNVAIPGLLTDIEWVEGLPNGNLVVATQEPRPGGTEMVPVFTVLDIGGQRQSKVVIDHPATWNLEFRAQAVLPDGRIIVTQARPVEFRQPNPDGNVLVYSLSLDGAVN